MSEKRNAMMTILWLSAIILVFFVADFMHGDRVFSETENRMLALKPEFSWESLLAGEFTEKYEDYVTDQFVGRDKWIRIKTQADMTLQKRQIKGVYLAADGYLIEQHLPEEFTEEQVEDRLSRLETLVRDWNATVMLVPTADNILSDKLPAFAPYFDEGAFLERVEERIGEDHFVDVYSRLAEHADEEIYYRTDHHWTSLGAYYGYQAWAESRRLLKVPYRTESMETVSDDFLGTLHSKINIELKGDSIKYFPLTAQRPLTVTYDLQRQTDTLYEPSYLETKNKYGFFLDDNHALVQIDTCFRNGRTLFVIKDSYANCFVPLLVSHYEHIYVLDLRYYNGRLYSLMESCAPEGNAGGKDMDVLVLYNCIHFLEEFAYY